MSCPETLFRIALTDDKSMKPGVCRGVTNGWQRNKRTFGAELLLLISVQSLHQV